ncbi:hypothetical protein DFH27DRAFT_620349 [Peziza echinospora]|nr:hypothetical protein DFH27DRAFT_620349 [Peziza echinospora]
MPGFAAFALSALKITSTVALGILTGTHLSFSLSTIQAILILPSARQARAIFTTLLPTHTTTLTTPLTLASTIPLLLAYLVSPRRLRHPYLLISAFLPLLAYGYDARVLKLVERDIANASSWRQYDDRGVVVGEEGGEEVVNGEAVRGGLERYRVGGLVRAGVVGVGFLVGVVGNWGDGWGYY